MLDPEKSQTMQSYQLIRVEGSDSLSWGDTGVVIGLGDVDEQFQPTAFVSLKGNSIAEVRSSSSKTVLTSAVISAVWRNGDGEKRLKSEIAISDRFTLSGINERGESRSLTMGPVFNLSPGESR